MMAPKEAVLHLQTNMCYATVGRFYFQTNTHLTYGSYH